MVDNEILGMCERVLRGIEVNDETLGVDVIERIGPGGNFITEDHTVMNMMNEFYNPGLADRSLYENWKSSGGQTMNDRARQALDELMATHNPNYISESEEQEIRSRFPEILD